MTTQSPTTNSGLTHQNDLIGQLVADRYQIIELLGSGGMGAVYRAEHVHMRKSVAFKVLHRELTHLSDVVARFEREAIAAARITHPNVAAATDFGRLPDGACYLVLEYVQGDSLRQTLRQSGPLDVDRALRIAKQVALALGAAHEAGVVHRDLKPENVMLVQGASEPDYAKVLDFGIAKIHMRDQEEQPALTRMGTIFGTPEYMSPEQALGQTADARTDLYSLGIMIYEMLTGRTPFADTELVAVLTRQMTEIPPPLPADIDPSIAALVSHLLAKRPSERPQNAQEVVTRIETLLNARTSQHSIAGINVLRGAETHSFATNSHISDTFAVGPTLGNPTQTTLKPSLPPWLRTSVHVGRRRLPLVIVLLCALGATVLGLLFVSVLSWLRPYSRSLTSVSTSGSPSVHTGPAAMARPVAPDPLLKRARLGELAALRALELRPDAELDAEHWAAIARGRARNREWAGVLEAYGHALDKAPSLLRDGELVSDIRNAALNSGNSSAALQFSAERLGPQGADLVYDAWAAAASGRSVQVDSKAAKKLLDDSIVRRQASASLLVALELSDARGCADYRRAIPKVISSGDERCLRVLRRLTFDRGCGLFGLGDCYSCLRGNSLLSQALEAAKSRQGPTF